MLISDLVALIPIGRENAITSRELLTLTGHKCSRRLYEDINRARLQGFKILATTQDGYYLSDNRADIEKYAKLLQKRLWSTYEIYRVFAEDLKVTPGQVEMNNYFESEFKKK